MLVLCFPPWNQAWLAWVAFTPLIGATCFRSGNQSGWNVALRGYVAGLIFFWTTFFWLTTVTVVGWFLLGLYLAVYLAIWNWLLARFVGAGKTFLRSRENIQLAVLSAAAWVGLEAIRGSLFSGFNWNALGVSLHANVAFIQVAELTGVAGLSFLIVFCNVIVAVTIRRFAGEIQKQKLRPHYDFSLAMILLVGVFAFGIHKLLSPAAASVPVGVALVQPNIPQSDKILARHESSEASEARIFDRYQHLTEAAIAFHPALIIWPEAATPQGMFGDETNFHFVADLVARGDFNLMLGTLDFDENGDYNIAALLSDRGEKIQTYRKVHLVPFGEYIPFRRSFPLFAMMIGDLVPGDFKAGREYTVLRTHDPDVAIAPLICFEDTLGDLTRRFVLRGAQILVNITNDGWFLDSPAAEQHLANAVFRAVENRRPLLRAANTGVSCFIDRFGRVTQALRRSDGSHLTQGVLFGKTEIAREPVTTFYTRHGEVFQLAATSIALVAFGLSYRRK
jgi:apolipoprotein N-acyltransferase